MFNSHQLQRFALRKYAVGVCSVMVASLMFLGSSQVSADQLEVLASPSTEQVADHGSLSQEETVTIVSIEEPVLMALATSEPEAPHSEPIEEVPMEPVKAPSSEFNQEVELEAESVAPKTEEEHSPSEKQPVVAPVGTINQAFSVPETKSAPDLSAPEDKLVTPKLSPGIGFRSVGMTRSATPAGVIGDDYPARWKNLAPDSSIDDWRLFNRNCTSFAAYRLSAVNGFELPPAYGDAGEWGERARREGYRVDSIPGRGSIAWALPSATNSSYGHVAWVAAVSGDMVTVEEYNYNYRNPYTYNTRTVHKSAFTGYIHFKILSQGTIAKPITTSNTHGLSAQGTYTFTKRTGVKNEPILSSPDRATYEVGEKVNYDKVLESDNHLWLSYINFSGGRSYVAIKELTPPPARPTTGSIQIQNKNPQTGDFEVVITDVYHAGGVREVRVPIWSEKGGQDDLVWYTAQHQGGTTYKVTVKVSQHKNDTGTYHVHLYYVQQNGQQEGVSGITTQVERQQTSQVNLPPQGTYRFTKTLPIKTQARMSSATIDYYYAGETVNYDRVLMAEGRQWISYISYGGARRYIPLT